MSSTDPRGRVRWKRAPEVKRSSRVCLSIRPPSRRGLEIVATSSTSQNASIRHASSIFVQSEALADVSSLDHAQRARNKTRGRLGCVNNSAATLLKKRCQQSTGRLVVRPPLRAPPTPARLWSTARIRPRIGLFIGRIEMKRGGRQWLTVWNEWGARAGRTVPPLLGHGLRAAGAAGLAGCWLLPPNRAFLTPRTDPYSPFSFSISRSRTPTSLARYTPAHRPIR